MKQCCDSLGSDESEQLKYPSVVFYRFEVLGLARARLNHRLLAWMNLISCPFIAGGDGTACLTMLRKEKQHIENPVGYLDNAFRHTKLTNR